MSVASGDLVRFFSVPEDSVAVQHFNGILLHSKAQ